MKASWIVLLAVGCGGFGQKSTESLTETIRAYNDGVRWGRYSSAAAYVPAAQRAQRVDDWDARAKDVNITDYQILNVTPHGDREAEVEVKLSWYRSSVGTLRETKEMQTWERHGKSWLLVDEARVKGPEMPGIPEPMMKD